jgi:hypothetical protein
MREGLHLAPYGTVRRDNGQMEVVPFGGVARYMPSGSLDLSSTVPLDELRTNIEECGAAYLDVAGTLSDNPEAAITFGNLHRVDRYWGHWDWPLDTFREGIRFLKGGMDKDEILLFAAGYAHERIVPELRDETIEALLRYMPPLYEGVEKGVSLLQDRMDVVLVSSGLEATTKRTAEKVGVEDFHYREEKKGPVIVKDAKKRGTRKILIVGDSPIDRKAANYARRYGGLDVTMLSVDKHFDPFFLDRRVNAAIPRKWNGVVDLLTDH